jgi:hypothetical protein
MSLVIDQRVGHDGRESAESTALRRWRDELARAFDGLRNCFPVHPASLA